MPWYAKILAAAVAGYALSPIDLIPDFIPVLGYADDLIIVPLGIWLVVSLIPQRGDGGVPRQSRRRGAAPAQHRRRGCNHRDLDGRGGGARLGRVYPLASGPAEPSASHRPFLPQRSEHESAVND